MAQFDQPPDMQSLTTLVRDCSVSGVTRRVLVLRIDLLPPRLSRPHHLRLAREALEPLQAADRARFYELAHGRMAISWRGEAADRLGRTLELIEHLLLDSPLDAPAMPELARLFDLPLDGAALLAVAVSPSLNENAVHVVPQREAAAPMLPTVLPPIDIATMDAVEARLSQANVARFARRRTVCRLGAQTLDTAWEERFLSVPALMAELAPEHNTFADPFLMRRLTRVVDRRLLALLSLSSELRGAEPFSMRLGVGSVLSPDFHKFDNALPPGLRGHALLALQPADVMQDLASFRFARAFARARGYRVVLCGLTAVLADLLDLAALDVDFVQLRWSPSLVGVDPRMLRAGTARWVLSDADEAAALGWGHSVGIGLFQGDAAQPGARQAPPRAAA